MRALAREPAPERPSAKLGEVLPGQVGHIGVCVNDLYTTPWHFPASAQSRVCSCRVTRLLLSQLLSKKIQYHTDRFGLSLEFKNSKL